MAKVTAPLLSFGARGQIAKTIVSAKWRGIPYMRQYAVPSNPNTTSQQATRNVFKTMTEMWKVAPALLSAPWNAFATGKQFLGLNAFIGQNVAQLRGEVDMDKFIGSPGAKGGLPPDTFAAATGGASGEVDVTFTNPAAPTGWTLVSEIFIGFPDQDPALPFAGPIATGENDPPTGAGTLTGLGSAVACQALGFLKWQKPDGSTAYSVSLIDQAVSGV